MSLDLSGISATPISLSISGADYAKEGVVEQYVATVTMSSGDVVELTEGVAWSVVGDDVEISDSGILLGSYTGVASNRNVTVHAEFTSNLTTVDDDKSVWVEGQESKYAVEVWKSQPVYYFKANAVGDGTNTYQGAYSNDLASGVQTWMAGVYNEPGPAALNHNSCYIACSLLRRKYHNGMTWETCVEAGGSPGRFLVTLPTSILASTSGFTISAVLKLSLRNRFATHGMPYLLRMVGEFKEGVNMETKFRYDLGYNRVGVVNLVTTEETTDVSSLLHVCERSDLVPYADVGDSRRPCLVQTNHEKDEYNKYFRDFYRAMDPEEYGALKGQGARSSSPMPGTELDPHSHDDLINDLDGADYSKLLRWYHYVWVFRRNPSWCGVYRDGVLIGYTYGGGNYYLDTSVAEADRALKLVIGPYASYDPDVADENSFNADRHPFLWLGTLSAWSKPLEAEEIARQYSTLHPLPVN